MKKSPELDTLITLAKKTVHMAYAPYSKFRVGCALLGNNAKLYNGANVENASYGLCLCAEQNAISSGVSDGMRLIKTIVIASEAEGYIMPCGACRQCISEFSTADTQIVCLAKSGEYRIYTIDELLPHQFSLK